MNTQSDVIRTICHIAEELKIDENLAVAIAMVESGGYPFATRFEPGWKYFYKPEEFAQKLVITPVTERTHQATSWGCMQVMGAVARELGYDDHLPGLCQPDRGARIGCLKLKALLEKYEDEAAVIAAYNAGSPRRVMLPQSGNKVFENQAYVDKVQARLKKLRMFG